jgi:hypothetical protein
MGEQGGKPHTRPETGTPLNCIAFLDFTLALLCVAAAPQDISTVSELLA